MNTPSVTIAHAQQMPTIASAAILTEALISPACSSPCSMTFLRRTLGVGGGERDDHHSDDQRGHDEIDGAPSDPRRKEEREGAADDRGGAIAELVDGREKFDRSPLVSDVDAPRVDRDILGRRREGTDHGEDCEPADRSRWIARAEADERDDQADLAQDDPARAPAEPPSSGS